ncbi:MAG: hypothetical protein ACTHNL_14060, partial [Devosia sp.]
MPLPATITRDNQKNQPQQTKTLPTSIIRDNHPVKRGHRIHPDRRSLSSELSRYNFIRLSVAVVDWHEGDRPGRGSGSTIASLSRR